MYVRFVSPRQNADSGFLEGVFAALSELRDGGELEDWQLDWLRKEYDWLNMHLKVPACLSRPENRRAICWFHPRAKRPIEKVRSLAALLEEHGRPIQMIKTRDPGQIIYEDGWQVVAKPRHRRTGKRARPETDGPGGDPDGGDSRQGGAR